MAEPRFKQSSLDPSSSPYTVFLVHEWGKLEFMVGEMWCFPLLVLSTYSVNIALLWLFKVPKLSFLKIEEKKTKRLIA